MVFVGEVGFIPVRVRWLQRREWFLELYVRYSAAFGTSHSRTVVMRVAVLRPFGNSSLENFQFGLKV